MTLLKARVLLILLFLLIMPVASATLEKTGSNNQDMIKPNLTELPELDMTGLYSDIELIEVDPEIFNATPDWIVLAHDTEGKAALIEEIDRSTLTEPEKMDMKNSVNELWISYPTKFEAAGEKTIEITVQSDGSNKKVTVPLGHVTRISFDHEKIRQAAQEKMTPHAKQLMSGDPSTPIVLSDSENQTVDKITGFRAGKKMIKKATYDTQSTVAGEPAEIAISEKNTSLEPEKIVLVPGIMSWAGWLELSISDPYNKYFGHDALIYWACINREYNQPNIAAESATDPDTWSPANPPRIPPSVFHPMFTQPVSGFIPFYTDVVHSYDHYYNPDRDAAQGNAPTFADDYARISRNKYAANVNDPDAAVTLGWASHYLTDVSNPMHTGKEAEQVWDRLFNENYINHYKYEEFVSHYSNHTLMYGDEVTGNYYTYNQLSSNQEKIFYRVNDPKVATENLAKFSHAYLDTLYYKVQNLPPDKDYQGKEIMGTGFHEDRTVIRITYNCIKAASRYTGGLVEFAMNKDTISEIPVADFTATPNPVCGGDYSVTFTDKTHLTYKDTTDNMFVRWEFGDGSTNSGNLYPTHPYDHETPTIYRAKLTTWNSKGSTDKTMDIIVGYCSPSAAFSCKSPEDKKAICTDKSLYSPSSWRWEFGDGTVSTEQNPIHTYGELKTYAIKLTASNEYGYGISTFDYYPGPPVSQVIIWVDKKIGPAPHAVQFMDLSQGSIETREWDFGDNSQKSTEKNPTHEYKVPGIYTANYTVNGTLFNTTTITVTGTLPASFTSDVNSGLAPLTVHFTDTSSGNPDSWNWSFGDDTWFNTTDPLQRNTTHQFTVKGTYNVTLYISNPSGVSTAFRIIDVTDIPPPIDFTPRDFTVPGNWIYTVPAGATSLNVVVVGGGGGGGSGNYNPAYPQNSSGGFGGKKGDVLIQNIPVSQGSNIPIFIGSGGSGASGLSQVKPSGEPGNAGGSGTDSYVGNYLAYGGIGGNGGLWPSANSIINGLPGENGYGSGRYATNGATDYGGDGGIGRGSGGGGGSGGVGPTLTAGNGANGYVLIEPIAPNRVVAAFSATPTTGFYPMTVQFTDSSAGMPNTWNWSFGDGNFSLAQNPVWTYVKAGTYTVNLTVTNGTINSTSRKNYISVQVPTPVSNFSVNITKGTLPMTVEFTDNSTGDITSWNWSFGDKSFSTLRNPVHTYTSDGNFTVRLNVSNALKYNISSQKTFIDAFPSIPIPDFSASNLSGPPPLFVKYTNLTPGNQSAWAWSFGDGNLNKTASPRYVYNKTGNYTVSLNVTNRAGSNVTTRVGYIYVYPTLIPNFTATPMSGNAPLAVQFTDTSTGGPLTWNWSFGDGTFSEDRNPVKFYPVLGKYNISLTVTNVTTNTTLRNNFINVSVALPYANFTANVTRGTLPVTVQFTDISTNNVTKWNWSFGDKGISNQSNPVYTYQKEGNYTVNLTVWNGRNNITVKTRYIDALPSLPVANFTANITTGGFPLTVQFTNTTTGNQTWWNWSFGDGNVSTLANPINKYSRPGNYTVILNVTNRAGFNASIKTNYITVVPWPPVANFTVNITSGSVPVAVKFNDTSVNSPSEWNWSFGDGNFSALRNPEYVYRYSGRYNVSLTAANFGGSNTATRKITVTVYNGGPVAGFTSDVSSGTAPLSVAFTGLSTNVPDGWTWFFGDENWSTSPWTRTNATAGWTARIGQSSVVMPDGSIVMTGGYDTTQRNDVWRSMDNGKTWRLQTASAAWTPRACHNSLAMPDGSIIVIGGDTAASPMSDVWRSTDNGTTWTQRTANIGWSARSLFSSAVLPDGSIVVSGGALGGGSPVFNDVWRSADMGTTWTRQTAAAGWPGRYGHSTTATPDGSIVLTGGSGYSNDAWRSTNNGITWVPVNASAGWPGRYLHSTVTMPDGSILVMGGSDGSHSLNNVWRSADRGATWSRVNQNPGWSLRNMQNSVVIPNGSMVLIGGYNGSTKLNDIWRFVPVGSSIESPSHTYTASGVYPVTLSAWNRYGFNTTIKTDFISVSPSGGLKAMQAAGQKTSLSEAEQNAEYYRLWNESMSKRIPVVDRNATEISSAVENSTATVSEI